eukprot:COSAG06_NODE_1580_length_9031_cov_6.088894_8_plen_355_part_00
MRAKCFDNNSCIAVSSIHQCVLSICPALIADLKDSLARGPGCTPTPVSRLAGTTLGPAGSNTASLGRWQRPTAGSSKSRHYTTLTSRRSLRRSRGQQTAAMSSMLPPRRTDSDQAVADLAALAAPARAIAVAAAAQQRASAVPKHVRPVPCNDQAVDHVVSSEGDCEPVPKRRKTCVATSEFVGVSWVKERKWRAEISHDGKKQRLGCFHDEREAALAVDTAARRLRGEDAHGGRSGTHWLRLNFPTEGEVKSAKDRRALLTADDKAAAVSASERQGPSKFVGVSWNKQNRKWKAQISHDGKQQHLGSFDDEHEAALAVDTAARRLRGEDAHGGREGRHWLNFPTEAEVKRVPY